MSRRFAAVVFVALALISPVVMAQLSLVPFNDPRLPYTVNKPQPWSSEVDLTQGDNAVTFRAVDGSRNGFIVGFSATSSGWSVDSEMKDLIDSSPTNVFPRRLLNRGEMVVDGHRCLWAHFSLDNPKMVVEQIYFDIDVNGKLLFTIGTADSERMKELRDVFFALTQSVKLK